MIIWESNPAVHLTMVSGSGDSPRGGGQTQFLDQTAQPSSDENRE